MSTIRAGTVSNVAGTGSPDITGGELSRVRFLLNGTGVIAASDTFNVASFVDKGTGSYAVNYSVAFPNNSYSPVGIATYPSVNVGVFVAPETLFTQTTTALGFATTVSSTGALTDMQWINCLISGDKP